MDRWNPFVRWPVLSLALCALLAIPFWLRTARSSVQVDSKILLESDQRNFEGYNRVREILGDDTMLLVSMECPDVFSRESLAVIHAVSEALLRLPGAFDVKSLTHSVKPVRRGMTFEMVPLVPNQPSELDLRDLREFCLNHPLVRNVMVAPDARHTIILLTLKGNFDEPARQRELGESVGQALTPFTSRGYAFKSLSLPLIADEMRGQFAEDLRRFVPVALILVSVVLGLAFRSWRLLLLFAFNQALAFSLLPGAMTAAGFQVDVFSGILLPLFGAMQLTLLIHVFTAFQQERERGAPPAVAILNGANAVFVSCAFAVVTTIVGLLAQLLTGLDIASRFGLAGSLGVALVFVLTFGPGLALMTVLYRKSSPAVPALPSPAWNWLGRLPGNSRAWLLPVSLLLVGVTALGLNRLRTDVRAIEFMPDASATRAAIEELDRTYGGINVAQIEFDSGRAQGINSLEFLRYLEKVREHAERNPQVSAIYSYPQLLAMMNQIWEGGRASSFKLPENPLPIALFVAALRTQEFPFLATLCDAEFRTATMVVRTRDMQSNDYLAVLRDIANFAQSNHPANVTVSAARGMNSIIEADRRMLLGAVHSAGFTLGVIGLLLALLWRSVWLAFAALAVNLVPVALMFGVAGLCDIPLNSFTIMIGAIVSGIAVDDSVHFITYWREARGRGASREDAVVETLRLKGRANVVTSLVLIAVFAAFGLSSFPPVTHFGLLAALALGFGLVCVLTILPAWLRK